MRANEPTYSNVRSSAKSKARLHLSRRLILRYLPIVRTHRIYRVLALTLVCVHLPRAVTATVDLKQSKCNRTLRTRFITELSWGKDGSSLAEPAVFAAGTLVLFIPLLGLNPLTSSVSHCDSDRSCCGRSFMWAALLPYKTSSGKLATYLNLFDLY